MGLVTRTPFRTFTLSSCLPFQTVEGLHSFIAPYKVLGRVLRHCSHHPAPLDNAISGLQSRDKIQGTEALSNLFHSAQTSLGNHQTITLRRSSDQLWIITDGSVTQQKMGATLYVFRHDQLLAGFYRAKHRKHQVEALSIAAACKHFIPYINQSSKTSYRQ